MKETALIFGAGKTGRGFAAHLAFLGGYEIILVDKNEQLVNDLKAAGEYEIRVLGKEEMNCTIKPAAVYQIDGNSWHRAFIETGIVFTAVFGNNLEDLAFYFAQALYKRHAKNPSQAMTIVTCENKTNAADYLKNVILKNLGYKEEAWLKEYIGFSEAIVFRTCLEAASDQSPLTIQAQAFFDLPCNGDAVKNEVHVYGLKPLKKFGNQLKRKIFTYNCINAVIAYFGAQKGYAQLAEAAKDEGILSLAKKAADESSKALILEFGFDPPEQEEWVNAAFQKFSDANVPDPIARNAADPVRKLSRDDRLIGPALLALKHGMQPVGLIEGTMACMAYRDPVTQTSVADAIKEKGVDTVLKEICGLMEGEELFNILKEQIVKRGGHGQ